MDSGPSGPSEHNRIHVEMAAAALELGRRCQAEFPMYIPLVLLSPRSVCSTLYSSVRYNQADRNSRPFVSGIV